MFSSPLNHLQYIYTMFELLQNLCLNTFRYFVLEFYIVQVKNLSSYENVFLFNCVQDFRRLMSCELFIYIVATEHQ